MAPGPDETEIIPRGRAGRILAAAASAVCGGANVGLGGAHVHGVVMQALDAATFTYDFRLASLLLIGAWLVVPGGFCLWRVVGLARGRRPAWSGALRATLVLAGVNGLLVPVQGFAVLLGAISAANLVALILLRRHYRQPAEPVPPSVPLAAET